MNGQFYLPATGWLHALDTRIKLCMTLVVVVLCSVWGNWMFLAAMLVVMHVMLLTDHVPARTGAAGAAAGVMRDERKSKGYQPCGP